MKRVGRVLATATLILGVLLFPLVEVNATPPYSNSLSVVRSEQIQTNWCWAASAKMIGDFMGYTHSQSDIVTAVKGYIVNSGASDSEVISALSYATNSNYYILNEYRPAISTIRSKIDSIKPIYMKMDWSNGVSHGVVVKGYNDYTQLIIVDPAMGCSQIKSYEYDALKCGTQILSGYGSCSTFFYAM